MTRRTVIIGIVALGAIVMGWHFLHGRSANDDSSTNQWRAGASTPRPHSSPVELAAAPRSESKSADPRVVEAAATASTAVIPATGRGPIHGVVVGDDWKPIAHATIRIVGDPIDAPVIETRPDGTFDVPDRGRRTAVWVHAPDVVMAADVIGWLARGDRNEIVLKHGAPIRVTVVSSAGARPVAGALVRSMAGDGAWAARFARPSDEAPTDADGHATVLVPPGPGYVTVEATGFAISRSPTTEVGEAGVDQRVELDVGAAIEGVVATASDVPVALATVRLVAGDLYEHVAVTKADGRFRLDGVPANSGPIALSVRADGFGPIVMDLEPLRTGETKRMDVRLAAAHAIDVLCLRIDGSAAVDVEVRAHPSDDRWRLVEGAERPAASGRSGLDGRVRLEPVGVGDWIVDEWSIRDTPAFSTTTVSVPPDAQVVSVVFRRPAPSDRHTVTVHVLDPEGTPVPEAYVSLFVRVGPPLAPSDSYDQLDDATTDARGDAVLNWGSVTPNSIVVAAEGFAGSVHAVSTSDLERAEIEFRLSGRSATLRFVRPDGKPAPVGVELVTWGNADVNSCVFPYGYLSTTPDHPTNDEGAITFRGLGDLWYKPQITTGGLVIINGPPTFRAGTSPLVWTLVPSDEAEILRTPIHLIDATTNEEIRRAQIVIVDSGELCSANDDADSKFLSPAMLSGEHDLDVFAEGYLPIRVPHVALAGSGKPAVLRLTLDRGATIIGTVRDAEGHPFPDASVGVSGNDASATTDEAGEFSISGLEGGARTIVITSSLVTRSVEKTVTAERAKVVRADLSVAAAGAVTVNTNSGAPRGTIRLTLRDAAFEIVDDDTGMYFEISGGGYNPPFHPMHTFKGLPAGRYWLDVVWDGVPERSIPVEVRLGKETSVTIAAP